MTPIERGQAIEMTPSPIVHACWLNDAEHDSGESVVVAACGEYAAPEDVHETNAVIDCMTCLVCHVKYDGSYDGGFDESIFDYMTNKIISGLGVPKEYLFGHDKDDGADNNR